MATKIEWTDETWNPVTGCSKVSSGCKFCYAETFAGRQMGRWKGRAFTDVRCHEDRLEQPLRWRKPRRVFVNSMSDLFHPAVPDAFIDRVFAVMALTPQHTYQVLTKRPERMRAYLNSQFTTTREGFVKGCAWELLGHPPLHKFAHHNVLQRPWPLPNVWLGFSAEDQESFNIRWPSMAALANAGWLTFCSAEPLLGRIDLASVESVSSRGMFFNALTDDGGALSWVIVGGESGPGARPCDVAWIRSIVRQCQAADVPCFVKQVGANVQDRNDRLSTEGPGCDPWDSRDWPEPEGGWDDGFRGNVERDLGGYRDDYQGAPVRLRLKSRKGGDHAEWPADLRVRQFPEMSRGRV